MNKLIVKNTLLSPIVLSAVGGTTAMATTCTTSSAGTRGAAHTGTTSCADKS